MESNRRMVTKERIAPYFEEWRASMPAIQQKYEAKDGTVREDMENAITKYEELLVICSAAGGSDRRTRLVPLNGEERLAFVKDKIISPFALVQLDALYTELQKKTARYTAK
ncbi:MULTISPECIES: YpoC family protein [Sporosarcina]|uniref:YpoC family protein n=1 Tax=Sporosarcina TaxID=1569 RepID=UPI00058E3BFA|nr:MULTISPECIES: hypothetical protein [Sporosarcina]WJY28566.1 hypothetical protein QWT68_06165 [Sporosarcina sp. 0.2-SM1T-5]